MVSLFIHYENSAIHVLYFGKGPEIVVCLHGYGESAASFSTLTAHLSIESTLIAIDLPFHGATQWNSERAFTVVDLENILELIFNALHMQQRQFILMGYSMGGRVAMSLLQHAPEKISKLMLLAPDGMKVNFWYWLATQTRTGNRMFRFTMNHPGWFSWLLRVSDRFTLVNKSVIKFINSYLRDRNARDQLFNRWTCMRTFKPDIKKIRTIIQKKRLPVQMLYGKHDRIILAKRTNEFRKGIESLCNLYIIDAGHQVLQQRYAGTIIKLLTT